MKLKTSHLLIIFIVLTGLVFLVKYLNNKKEKGSLLTEFFELNIDEINKFTLTPQFNPVKKFDVLKENTKWYVINSGGYKYEVSSEFMDRALKELQKLKPSRLASTSSESFAEFGVDSLGTLLEIFDNNASHSIILGSMTFQNQNLVNTYCRLPDDQNTYAAEAYMEGTFKSDINGWRKRDIIPFPSSSWNALSFLSPDGKISIQMKKDGNKWLANGVETDSTIAADMIKFVERLNSLGFADDSQTTTLSQPTLSLTVSQADSLQPVQLNLYRTPSNWLLNSSINEGNYFTADTNRVNPLLLNLQALTIPVLEIE